MNTFAKLGTATALAAALAACQTTPPDNADLSSARQALAQASANPNATRDAAVELNRAQQALRPRRDRLGRPPRPRRNPTPGLRGPAPRRDRRGRGAAGPGRRACAAGRPDARPRAPGGPHPRGRRRHPPCPAGPDHRPVGAEPGRRRPRPAGPAKRPEPPASRGRPPADRAGPAADPGRPSTGRAGAPAGRAGPAAGRTGPRRQAETTQQQLAQQAERSRAMERDLQALQGKQTQRGMVVTLGDVLFATGRDTLQPGARRSVQQLADVLKQYPRAPRAGRGLHRQRRLGRQQPGPVTAPRPRPSARRC